jgi:hypothetical protein
MLLKLPVMKTRSIEFRLMTLTALGLTLAASLAAQGTAGVFTAKAPAPALGTVTADFMYFGNEASLDGKMVTGAPYMATVTTTMTQTLANGTHIVQKQEASFARDGAGRTRREESLNNIGPWSTSSSSPIVFINDPVAQVHYVLEPDGKTAMKMSLQGGPTFHATTDAMQPMGKTIVVMGQADTLAQPTAPAPPEPGHVMSMSSVPTVMPDAITAVRINGGEPGPEDKVEKLADQTIEGVLAQGKRVTTTIPSGAIGNDQPILVVSETWYSPDLQTIILSKRTDPQIGESVMSVTNIQRGEPSATLFQVPAGYTVKDGPVRMKMLQPPPPPPPPPLDPAQ